MPDRPNLTETGRLIPISTKTLNSSDELYKVVDFLNKTLKHKNLMFGLTKNTRENTMTVSVYEI